jgi:hypothetical protein
MDLPDNIYDQVEELSAAGNDLYDQSEYPAAVGKWTAALELLPEPKSDWQAFTWLSASIGDAHYQNDNLDGARQALFDALNGPGGVDNPFVHYRLGQSEIRLGNEDNGIRHLLKAYMLDGERIFSNDEDGAAYLQKLADRGLVAKADT